MMRRVPLAYNPPGQGQAQPDGEDQSGQQNRTVRGLATANVGGSGAGQQSATPVTTRPRAPTLLFLKPSEESAGNSNAAPTGQDSITLLQLKAHTAAMEKKQKTQLFDFRYDDTDTLMNELEEFYPYVEMEHIKSQPDKFKGSFEGDWTEAPVHKRKQYIELQLEYMESPVHEVRRMAQGRLLYLLQGSFAETTSPEMQLHWVIENAKAVRAVDGVATIVVMLRDAARKYTASAAEDKPSSGLAPAGTIPAQVDPYDDRSAELMDLVGMLYFIVEVFRTDETFGDELMAMSPPLPLVLFHMVSSLKDRLPKGYPVKKVLLLLWKTLLACLGGMKEVAKAKALSREWAGLPPEQKNLTKSSPLDITTWRRDTAVKYPTFAPPPSIVAGVSNEKLSEGMKPIPARPNYHSTEIPVSQPRYQSNAPPPTSNPLPGTPAPSPPPSPAAKPKKQQYQTDPTRPFVFPYSRSSASAPTSLVPFAISEADKLYHRHEYISLGLYQMWQAREECMREERGLGRSGLLGLSTSAGDEEEDEEAEEAMMRDWKYEQEEMDAQAQGNKEGARIAREKRAAARRLHRVEIIYKNTLPIQQSCVIVLLKLLLATVTSPGAASMNLAATTLPPGITSPTQESAPSLEGIPPPTKEELDISRHREITSKAVSAILLLLLKWFKASHVLKFHHFAQLLFDSNCALLVLKMFGLTDLLGVVQCNYEMEDLNFFRFCHLNCSRSSSSPEDDLLLHNPPKPSPKLGSNAKSADGATASNGANGEDVELISEYSWRNFFSTINFLKILQKMTKHRSHRTYMMTTYKSSQILKRMLRVNHPMLQLQVLKLIKSQMPWCGRKWRQTNMKIITSIYLNCRPELRDDWLAGTDLDAELDDALPQEYALRSLVQFYNKRHYSAHLAPLPSPEPAHKRSNSTSAVTLEDPALAHGQAGSHVSHVSGGHPRTASLGESDVFPPRKSTVAGASLPYNPDGMIEFWLHEYEDVLGEVFGEAGEGGNEVWEDFGLSGAGGGIAHSHDDHRAGAEELGGPSVIGAADRDDRAWNRLSEIMRGAGDAADDISDSESVVSVGELGDEARLDSSGFEENNGQSSEEEGEAGANRVRRYSNGGQGGQGDQREVDEEGRLPPVGRSRRKSGAGENTWEHMSPTLALLPRSPAERRRSSSSGAGGLGSPLRPVIPGKPSSTSNSGSGSIVLGLGDDVFEDDEIDTRGPMPIKGDTRDLEEREGGAVDEVEYTYGE